MLCVIGAGNVVEHKLLPALLWLGVDLRTIEIHGTHDDPEHLNVDGTRLNITRHHPKELPDVAANTDLTPWLATPPFSARRELLAACRGQKIVCEKPLGTNLDDLLWLDENLDALTNAFVLSYYAMEKFAPLLWLTGALKPPEALISRGAAHLDAGPDLLPIHAELILSEPLVRTAGDTVSAWQQGEGIYEFAVHAPAILAGLNLPATAAQKSPTRVLFAGPGSQASVTRPGPNRKTVTLAAANGTGYADGQERTAWTSVDGATRNARLDTTCPPYGSVVAYALEWLNGGIYHGDRVNQLHALRLLAHQKV